MVTPVVQHVVVVLVRGGSLRRVVLGLKGTSLSTTGWLAGSAAYRALALTESTLVHTDVGSTPDSLCTAVLGTVFVGCGGGLVLGLPGPVACWA